VTQQHRHRRANQAALHGPCLVCSRQYEGTAAHPRWAFNIGGRWIGSVHTSCRMEGILTAPGELDLEDARFVVWHDHIYPKPRHPRPGRYDVEWEAWIAARQRIANPNAEFRTSDPLLVAYAALHESYREWRSRLGADGPV